VNGSAAAASRLPAIRRGAAATLALAWLAASLWFSAGEHASPWAAHVLQRVHVAEHVGIHLGLALWFGATLRPGAVPLITRLAARVHGTLTPAKVRYTRAVTAIWTGTFAALAALSLVLYAWLSFAGWTLFADVASPLLLAALFFGEYALRYRLHPEFERTHLRDMVRAWRQPNARPADVSRMNPP
jgi:uncharacterized membrane protein